MCFRADPSSGGACLRPDCERAKEGRQATAYQRNGSVDEQNERTATAARG